MGVSFVSNNKAEATYHGRKRAFLIHDRVLFTELPAFNNEPGEVVEIRDSLFPYLVRLDSGTYVGSDWLSLQPAAPEFQRWASNPAVWINGTPTTGEHFFQKVDDDLYQDWADRVPAPRSWTPTPGEIRLALAIVALIILIFVFIVVFY